VEAVRTGSSARTSELGVAVPYDCMAKKEVHLFFRTVLTELVSMACCLRRNGERGCESGVVIKAEDSSVLDKADIGRPDKVRQALPTCRSGGRYLRREVGRRSDMCSKAC
jgi:hypothetical protein